MIIMINTITITIMLIMLIMLILLIMIIIIIIIIVSRLRIADDAAGPVLREVLLFTHINRSHVVLWGLHTSGLVSTLRVLVVRHPKP